MHQQILTGMETMIFKSGRGMARRSRRAGSHAMGYAGLQKVYLTEKIGNLGTVGTGQNRPKSSRKVYAKFPLS